MKQAITLFTIFFIAPSFFLYGNESDNLWPIDKTSETLNFDGICDEPLWDSIDPLPMQMYRPNHGGQTTERSEIYVTYDDDFFYLGARLYYENGSKVVATSKKRDGGDPGSDSFGILLDTFNDNENALCFSTNPAGIRSDFSIANDAQTQMGNLPFNSEWNTFWDVKAQIIDNVWNAEIRIPLSSLRFQEQDGQILMGMTVWRLIASKQEWNIFPLITNEFGSLSMFKPSLAKKVVLTDIERKNPVYITPYVLTGIEQNSEMNESGTAYEMKQDQKLTAGLDLKYALTSNMTLDLTLNTDFAQVEADDQMVNITRFSIFFPEKRQFFLERNSIFTMRTGMMDQLFYSRRIGLEDGEIIPIIAGVRLVGRAGKYDLGFMDMQTLRHEYKDDDDSLNIIESTNHGVLRMRKQVFNSTSYAGGMITSKVDINGNYNVNTAVDLIYNPFRNDFLTANYTQTFDSDHPVQNDFYNYGKLYLNWENRSNVGLSYQFLFSRAGKNYNPELGFELLDDYTRAFGSLSYGWVYNAPQIKKLSQQLSFWSWQNKRNEDMKTNIASYEVNYALAMKSGYRYRIGTSYNNEFLDEDFDLSDDVYFPTGDYSYAKMDLMATTPSNKLFALTTMASFGQYYDGYMFTFGPAEITYRASANVKLAMNYQYNQVDIPDRNQYFKSHLARLKTELTFTTKLSLLMFFQYSSIDHFGVNNIRFRYNPKEGNDLYLVYNGGYNSDLYRESPYLPRSEHNSLILKYTYTFIWEKR